MIFVILGTQKFQLNRLLKELDALINEGRIQEEVFAQIGNSNYCPENFKFVHFLDKADFDKQIGQADLIITHSGVGSIITALHAHKPVIVFPRLAKYKEHVDDHQLDIANAFEKKQFVLCCRENEHLIEVIERTKTYSFKEYQSQTQNVIAILKNYIERSL